MLIDIALAGAATVCLTPLVTAVLDRCHVVDRPGHRSSHDVPTVRGGGLAPAIAVIGTLAAGGVVAGDARVGLLVIATGFTALGLVEDVHGVPPVPRLACQLLVAATALPWLALAVDASATQQAALWLVATAWLAGYANAFNFMDGINGNAGMQVVAAGLAWVLLGLATATPVLVWGSLLLTIAAAGFLPFNFPRARVFLGDAGSYFFGACLAAIVVVGLSRGVPLMSLLAPLSVTLADTGYTLARRLRRRDVWHEAHREHVYQRLVLLGWTHARTTGFLAALTASSAALGLLGAISAPWQGLGVIGIVMLMIGYLFTPRLVVGVRRRRPPRRPVRRASAPHQAPGG